MINLKNIKSNVFTKGAVIAEIYQNSRLIFKTMITPFKTEMQQANNIILFVDNDYNITGGQIGLYDYDNGLRVKMF